MQTNQAICGILIFILAGTASSGLAGDVTTSKGIIAMDGGHEILMDKNAPEDRIVAMGDGEEIFMDKRKPEDRIVNMGEGEEI